MTTEEILLDDGTVRVNEFDKDGALVSVETLIPVDDDEEEPAPDEKPNLTN